VEDVVALEVVVGLVAVVEVALVNEVEVVMYRREYSQKQLLTNVVKEKGYTGTDFMRYRQKLSRYKRESVPVQTSGLTLGEYRLLWNHSMKSRVFLKNNGRKSIQKVDPLMRGLLTRFSCAVPNRKHGRLVLSAIYAK
jgi:hypothetical protein